jgi:hypothetical protein
MSSMEAKWWYDEAHYTEAIGNHSENIQICAHSDNVKLEIIEFPSFSFEFCADRAHLIRGESLVRNRFIVDIDRHLADVDAHDRFSVGR